MPEYETPNDSTDLSPELDTPDANALPETLIRDTPVIDCLFTGECPSVSGRSTLTYAIGRHPDQSLHLRLVSNTGSGMFCGEWASGDRINSITLGTQELTSRSFNALHPGKSINTGGFVMSALRHLGLLRPRSANTRFHEHIPGSTFESVVANVLDVTKSHAPESPKKARSPKPSTKAV